MDTSKFDFSGWATRNNLKCSDGRTILKDAFKHNDGQTVPLVWNHQHNEPSNILGHALLENREEGVYAYGTFNDTEAGQMAKTMVMHGDITQLSIFANQLKHTSDRHVTHGAIREVSLVLAGANPGAFIDTVICHGEESDEEGVIYTGMDFELAHAETEEKPNETNNEGETKMDNEKTVQDVIDGMDEDEKKVMYALIGKALEEGANEAKHNDSEGGDTTMKHNVFDEASQENNETLAHSAETIQAVFADAKRYGSLKESALAHGVDQIDWLFPEDTNITNAPTFIDRDQGWVKKVMGAVHHTPYSRIKSMFADITADEARARGYIKGNLKKEEVFTLLKRTTSPTTVYKKQKLDRDDVIDITDFDVVAWIKAEMRGKLDEELARAYLIGDGRLPDSDDKIKEDCIRPIWTDDTKLFTINAMVEHDGTEEGRAQAFIKKAIKARKGYKGSGNLTLYTTEDLLTEMLLLTDGDGRDLYEDETKLAKKLRVKEIVTVPVMEGAKREVDGAKRALLGIFVNMNDYNVGADKGGAVNMFDDFDIDYNAQKYLMETRCSGALIRPFSAIVLEEAAD
jgi:HK97 family phage prohead protease